MATTVLLLDADVTITSSLMDDLARLGVTTVSICRDGTTVGVILEGWAFERSSVDEAARCLGASLASSRVLNPTVQMALLPMRT